MAMIHGGLVRWENLWDFLLCLISREDFCGFKGGDSPPTMSYKGKLTGDFSLGGGKIILYTCLGLEGLRSGDWKNKGFMVGWPLAEINHNWI